MLDTLVNWSVNITIERGIVMKNIYKLMLYKDLLIMRKKVEFNIQLDNKANQIYGNDLLPKMKIKSLYRKVR